MSRDPRPIDAHRLLAEGRTLRALARTLVGADAGEDVVHDAYVAALQQRGPVERPGAWLTGVVMRLSARLRRTNARRSQREHRVANWQVDATADPAQIAEQAEALREIANAVHDLDEPFRTVVVLRYWHDASPGEIASQLGVPVETVRTRLHRGIERVRAQLDRHRGGREAWRGALLVLLPRREAAGSAMPHLAFAGLLMNAKLLASILASVALVFVLAQIWQRAPGQPHDQARDTAVAQPVSATLPVVVSEPQRIDAAPVPPTAEAPASKHRVRCVDEWGTPVARAAVRLVRMPYGCGVPDREGICGDDGQVVFDDVETAKYIVRARRDTLHHIPHFRDINKKAHSLPAAPLDIELREAWIGGVVMPGTPIVAFGHSLGGFTASTNELPRPDAWPSPEAETSAIWSAKHPDARFIVAFQDPRRRLVDTLRARVHWYGHHEVNRDLRMWRVSQFPGPEVVDDSSVPARPWASVRVALTTPEGTPLPAALASALRPTLRLCSSAQPMWNPIAGHALTDPVVRLPVGEYELRRPLPEAKREGSNAMMAPVAKCTITTDTEQVQLPIAVDERVVRLRVNGLKNAGYMLQLTGAAGPEPLQFGRIDGDHDLLLRRGAFVATFRRVREGVPEELRRNLEVTDAIEQLVTWDVSDATWETVSARSR
jgi:RNA polymerase sigma factor (sigma-70 family)